MGTDELVVPGVDGRGVARRGMGQDAKAWCCISPGSDGGNVPDSVAPVGFLDRAKKLAEQAKEMAEQATKAAEGALGDVRARAGGGAAAPPGGAGAPETDPRWGTPYRPGMLGRPGWREEGLTDPAALLPIADRHRAGIDHSTKSEVVEEPFGMGRRWVAGEATAGLFYRLHADHRAWEPPGGRTPVEEFDGGWQASLPDGRALMFLPAGPAEVVLETAGIDDSSRSALAYAVARQVAGA